MASQVPDELQPLKNTGNNLAVEYYGAILRKYARLAATEQTEALTTLQEAEEYLSTTPDTLKQRGAELIRRINDLFYKW